MSLTPTPGEAKKRVCYFFDSDIGNYHYGPGHPMKPTRIRMCHALVMNYGLYKKMEIFRAKPATKREMSQFHSDEYVEFLQRITPENMNQFTKEQMKYNVGDDCPVFDGLFEYCSISAGGSMEGAARLSRDKCDIAINWAGGLHHAKKSEASGFCFINDIVLGVLELLRYHERVLYIDIDVHHGDGVEEAFYTTDRVMTVSFHKYGEFFPGTGGLRDRGIGKGKDYAINVPLHDGIGDEAYASIFKPVIQRTMEWYRPNAVVLQCGSDSLAGDRIGPFNLSMKGHAECVKFVKSFGLPLLLLGGGGYTMRNVARAWCYETGLAAGVELGSKLPVNEYFSYFGPDYQLDVPASNQEDFNTPEYLQKIKASIFEQMRDKNAVPSVGMQGIPAMPMDSLDENADEDEVDMDDRKPQKIWDKHIAPETELSDSEDEGQTGRKERRSHKEKPRSPGRSPTAKGKEREHEIVPPLPPPESSPTAPASGLASTSSTATVTAVNGTTSNGAGPTATLTGAEGPSEAATPGPGIAVESAPTPAPVAAEGLVKPEPEREPEPATASPPAPAGESETLAPASRPQIIPASTSAQGPTAGGSDPAAPTSAVAPAAGEDEGEAMDVDPSPAGP